MNQTVAASPKAEETATPAVRPTFDALALSPDIRKAIDTLGYLHPTPVQLAVFEPASRGKNLVVQARTGTGKTAAFGLPVLDALVKKSQPNVQALILSPTRELALQISRELERIAEVRGTKIVAVYGGAPMGKQVEALEGGSQIVVGTPGRVLDHIRRGTLDTSNIRIFVLDEADEMLSMGFAKELNAIIEALPKERQGLYFSATLPPDVERLATKHLRDPEWVTLSSDSVGALEIDHFVYLVREGDKRGALVRIVEVEDPESAIVFCNTKDETERVCEALRNRGYDAEWLNGDLEQKERERIMARTREGKVRFLVATDVAARGIDISHLTHVINADFPESAEYYVHRTGRTGRAGKTGTAISVVGPKDVGHLYMLRLTYKIRPIEKMLPTAGELKTRAETDLVAFLADAYAAKTPDPLHVAVARRLLTHENVEGIVAGLLADHLGASADAPQDAAEARRAKNPPPVPVVREEMPRTEPRAEGPRTLRDGEHAPRERRPEGGRDRDRGRNGERRDDRGPRRDRPTGDRPFEARRDRSDEGRPVIGFTVGDAPAAPAARPAGDRPRDGRGERPRDDRPRHGRDERPRAPRDDSPARDGRVPEERAAREARSNDRPAPTGDRIQTRRGLPHATLSTWEPAADADDDAPIFAEGGTKPGLGPNEAAPVTARGEQRERQPRNDAPRDRDRSRGDRERGPAPVSAAPRSGEAHVNGGAEEGAVPEGFANLFLNVGRRDGLTPTEIVRLLGEHAEVTPSDTGRIHIRDRIAFVAVREEVAEKAIAGLVGQTLNGRTINVEIARARA